MVNKVFEDFLSELQTDMVSVCLEYINHNGDDIFIYCSYEPKMYVFDVFYKINGKIVHKHELNEAIDDSNVKEPKYDVSRERQRALLRIGNENLKEIHKRCKEFNQPMPTEIKLHYSVKQNSLKGQYKYELIYSNGSDLLPDDVFDMWFEDIKNNSK